MAPTWFLMLIAFCAGWSANTAMRIFSGHEVRIGGKNASRSTTAVAIVIILVAVGVMTAIQLGFISDHAP